MCFSTYQGSNEGTGITPGVLDEPTASSVAKVNRSVQQSGGSNEGTGIIPGVPDELTAGSVAKAKHDIVIDWGSKDESGKSEEKISDEEEENKDDDDDDKSIDLEKTNDGDDDDECTTHDETMTYAEDDESDDEERTNTDSDEQVKDDTEKTNKEKVEDEGDADLEITKDEQGLDDQARDDHLGELLKTMRKENSNFPLSSSRISTSSNFEIPLVHSAPLLDVLASVIPPQSTPIPTSLTTLIPAPPSSIVALNVTTTVPDLIPSVVQRVSVLEQEVKELKEVDHSTTILASVRSHVSTIINDYLGSTMGDTLHKVLQNHTEELVQQFSQKDVFEIIKVKVEQAAKEKILKCSSTLYDLQDDEEYKQKDILFRMMMASKSHERHSVHQALYDALLETIYVDEDDMDRLDVDLAFKRKRRHDDRDEDPSVGSNQGKKKKGQEDKYESSKKPSASKESSRGKTPLKSSKTGKSVSAKKRVKEATHEVAMDVEEPTQEKAKTNVDQPKDDAPKTSKTSNKNWFKQPPRPLTPDPERNTVQTIRDEPKQTWFNDMMHAENPPLTFDELMATPIDFSNFVMNRLKIDNLTQEVLLGLVYNLLKEKRRYITSITKIKAAKRKLWYRSQINTFSLHDVHLNLRILSVVSVKVEKLHCYMYLKEIIVRRADRQLYKLKEVALRMFARRITIRKHVEDVQLGVESYQKKLNLTRPQQDHPNIDIKEPYTPSFDPPGAIYEDASNRKRLMRADELYKFSGRTLKLVRNKLHYWVLNFKMGYNKDMPRRRWPATDQK
uniref:Uncharacterized protein n=1 Tax=Tanacetum cinerariifolium TaxID=118510 RepID=A0A6L2J9A9_TANCI|nr:hypothetical protein [Tanacetum cinerariifolium]